MTIPPIRWNDDGSNTFALIGTEEDIQAAVAGVPTAVQVDIEEVGGTAVRPEQVRGQLSNQQRKAVKTAVTVGYYDTPRGTTIERIADEMGCAHSTASEHLQRAESKVMASLFDSSHENLR